MPTDRPERQHLRRLDQIWVDPAVYFITTNVIGRQPVLVSKYADLVVEALHDAAERNLWTVGRYVVMPDHVHLFCADRGGRRLLHQFVGGFKQRATRLAWKQGWQGRLWQAEFFDHVLRSDESYAEKWEYVRQNPVRRGLCARPDDWPHQGEMTPLPRW